MDTQRRITNRVLNLGLQILFYAIIAASLPASGDRNTTIVVPGDVSNHGSPNLLCTPASWTDVALFYLGNYAAHAATVRTSPGEALLDTIVNVFAILLFPQAGAMKGLNAIFRCAVLERSPLQRAARSGALCMVIRTPEWRPRTGDSIRGVCYMSEEFVKNTLLPSVPWGREIHGVCKLPPGYGLAFVPRHAKVRNIQPTKLQGEGQDNQLEENFESTISSSFSTIKTVIAIAQTLYASFTLYRTRGDQLAQYGYAAFGLTVTPFLVMSIINLIGNLVTPEYATLYMVRSDIMEEAKKRGALIDGEVGEIVPAEHSAWNFGVPNDLTGTFTQTEEDVIGLASITYSSKLEPEENLAGDIIMPLEFKKHSTKVLNLTPAQKVEPVLIIPSCNNFAVTQQPVTNLPAGISDESQLSRLQRFRLKHSLLGGTVVLWGLNLIITGISIAVIGGLSGFRKGNSTTAQRVWTMMWISFGFLLGPNIVAVPSATSIVGIFRNSRRNDLDPDGSRYFFASTLISSLIIYGVPGFGGYVVIGKMLYEYGSCIDIS
ncbi:hypothetical protein AAE478_008981 [Parahypoxylon ruwenzoriense]